jgi:hypothetical protein
MILFSELSKEGCLFRLEVDGFGWNFLSNLLQPETIYMTLSVESDLSWRSMYSFLFRCLNLSTGKIDTFPLLISASPDPWTVRELTKVVETDKAVATC